MNEIENPKLIEVYGVIMRTDILDYLQNEIYTRCKKPTNKFGMGCYYHIAAVVKNGAMLAEKYNADKGNCSDCVMAS